MITGDDTLLARVVCPTCRSVLALVGGELACASCQARFPLQDGTPCLVGTGLGTSKLDQIAFYDEHPEAEHQEALRPWDRPRFHSWLLEEKFRLGFEAVASGLAPGASALVVCGGSGLDAEFLAARGLDVVSADIWLGACHRAMERSRRRGVSFCTLAADAEQLPFRDRSS